VEGDSEDDGTGAGAAGAGGTKKKRGHATTTPPPPAAAVPPPSSTTLDSIITKRPVMHLSRLRTHCKVGDLILFKSDNSMSGLQVMVTMIKEEGGGFWGASGGVGKEEGGGGEGLEMVVVFCGGEKVFESRKIHSLHIFDFNTSSFLFFVFFLSTTPRHPSQTSARSLEQSGTTSPLSCLPLLPPLLSTTTRAAVEEVVGVVVCMEVGSV
jgi:hypothetical protein